MIYTKTTWVNNAEPFISAANLNKIEQALADLGLALEASNLLTTIKTVDGTGSGLDADLLDGNSSTAFATSSQGSLADTALQDGDTISANLANGLSLANSGSSIGPLRFKALGGGSAGAVYLSFERDSTTILFGIDTDGKLKIGGGSLGVVSYEILNKGNTKVVAGTSTFLGNMNNRTIAHGLGSTPTFVTIMPNAPTSGYLGEFFVTKDAVNFYVYNTGSGTTSFAWKAELWT